MHDLRVATRRLLATVDCFEGVLRIVRRKKLRKRLKGILRAGREVRDRDIALNLAEKAGIGRASPLVIRLRRERREAAAALGTILQRGRYRRFAGRWTPRLAAATVAESAVIDPRGRPEGRLTPDWIGEDSVTSNARRVLPVLAAGFQAAGCDLAAGDPSPRDLHSLRLDAKQLRYCLELFREAWGPGIRPVLRDLRRLQDRLGTISDCDATEALVSSGEMGPAGDRHRLVSFLRTRSGLSRDKFLSRWRKTFSSPDNNSAWLAPGTFDFD